MALSQSLNEFRFNLETLDMMTTMGKSSDDAVNMLGSLGFNNTLVNFMTNSRSFLNGVLLRLQLYVEQNLPEARVRTSLTALNNMGVNSLVDYLYTSSTPSLPPTPVTKKTPPTAPVPTPPTATVESEHDEIEDEAEESHFDTFFEACVRETEDASDVVKLSDFYSAFTNCWSTNCEDETPSKEELKAYLAERLGRTIGKSGVTNVTLV